MTHDELLARIDKTQKMYLDWDEENGFTHEPNDFLQALRAVVELHSPDEYEPGQCSCCRAYANDGEYDAEYPCWTIQAIEEKLG